MTLTLGRVCIEQKGKYTCRYVPHNMSNQRMHWSLKKKWNDAWKEEVNGQFLSNRKQFGKLPLEFASIGIQLKVCKLMDYDGAYNAIKPVLDSLTLTGIIKDDSPTYIDLAVKQEKVKHLNEQGVIITIQ